VILLTIVAMVVMNNFAKDVSARKYQNSNVIMINVYRYQRDVIYWLIVKIRAMKESRALLVVDVIWTQLFSAIMETVFHSMHFAINIETAQESFTKTNRPRDVIRIIVLKPPKSVLLKNLNINITGTQNSLTIRSKKFGKEMREVLVLCLSEGHVRFEL